MTTTLDHLRQAYPDSDSFRLPTWDEVEPTLPRQEAIRERRDAERTIARIARKNGDMRPVEHLMASLKDIPTTLDELEARR